MTQTFPRALADYPPGDTDTLLSVLVSRIEAEPFNLIASTIFALAILHTFTAARITAYAHARERREEAHELAAGSRSTRPPSGVTELLHFIGEVEVTFGLWAVVLAVALVVAKGWHTTTHYLNDTVTYTEPLFVVVIMALASTRPIVVFAESVLRRIANIGGGTPAAWWLAILLIGPLLGSFITEPGAMTICALLLGRQFYDLQPSVRLKYATLGALFVSVSIGGTLTHFAAPPVLMVARPWGWDTTYMLSHFGWKAVTAIAASTLLYYVIFRREFSTLARRAPRRDEDLPDEESEGGRLLPVPGWVIAVHVLFMAWTVVVAHYPALFLAGFLFFLGFTRVTAPYQSLVALRTPLLVGFFLAGLVVHGGLQGWWIEPVIGRLPAMPLFLAATVLTAFNDNALVTYLATLVPGFSETLKLAVVQGAVVGGGLTVIANAPNPAGQALLSRFFDGAVVPLHLLAGALLPTVIAALVFLL